MSATQSARSDALAHLSEALGSSNDDERVLSEIYRVLQEAASIGRIDTIEDAAASLCIVLRAMGVDPDDLEDAKPHERLVQLVRQFLIRAKERGPLDTMLMLENP
jgi:hypothetical protein